MHIRVLNDRNLTIDIPGLLSQYIHQLDLSGKIIFDFGIGDGGLLTLLINMPKERAPAVMVGFELAEYLNNVPCELLEKASKDEAIFEQSNKIDQNAKLCLLNPKKYFLPISETKDKVGNFQYYDFDEIFKDSKNKQLSSEFLICGNPPFFLWNRILSLTFLTNYSGILAITGIKRLMNHRQEPF